MQIFTQVSTKYIGFAVCAEPPGGGFRLLGISWVYCAMYGILSYFSLAQYLCILVCFTQFALYLTCLVSYFWCAILCRGLKLCFVCAPFLQRAAAVQYVEGDYSALSAYLWPHTDSLSAAASNHHHHHHHHPYHKNHDRCHYHLHHLFITRCTQTYICHLSTHVRMRIWRLSGLQKFYSFLKKN